jgi:radical SAM superfamily enzyme YgiQ (UPF0313 family)
MNILLVAPSILDNYNQPMKYKKAFLPPLSLAVLDSLTPPLHNVTIINDVVEKIDYSIPYDLVGITAMTTQSERTYQIADKFRQQGKNVILGGVHPTMLPEEAKLHADSIVIGEADNIWQQILIDCENNTLKDFYQDNTFPDLSKLILPKWDNMNMDIYPKKLGARLPMMPLFTTRGCPYKCKFCSVSKFFGKHYRTKPVEHVLLEIEHTKAENYFFIDDNIACNPDYSRELFKSLQGRGLTWFSQVSTRILETPDLLDLAAQSGCNSLFVGVESINRDALRNSNKGFNKVEKYEELIQRMRKAGIVPYLSFIFGFDEDTPEQFRLTVEFLIKNKATRAIFWILVPLPGTVLFNEMTASGRITDTRWSNYDGTKVVFEPKSFSKNELTELYWKSFRKMYTFPKHVSAIWQSIKVTKNPPLKAFLEASFFRFYFGKKLSNLEHPFTAGFGRRNVQSTKC